MLDDYTAGMPFIKEQVSHQKISQSL